jgi:hypothetical protein
VSVHIGQGCGGDVLRAPNAVLTSRQTISTLVLIVLHPSEAAYAVDDPRNPTTMCTIQQ